ncbi:MAG: class II glutamine amidotransferase [Solirubrobacteraceae bacterium]
MCRLFGMSAGPARASATFWLLQAPDSLSQQSRREPDGTGLGWFDAHARPQIRKQPIAAYEDREFAREAHEVSSRNFVAHVRFASTGALQARNTHPFQQDGRLFAHNGVIEGLSELDAELGDALDLVGGDTDSERFFALITREAARRGGDLHAGIETACSWIATHLPIFAINFVLATADGLWALRYPETHDLYVLERQPGEQLEHASRIGSRVHSEHGAEHPLVVIASERMDEDPAWRALQPGELIHVLTDLDVSSRIVLPDPPAHQLSLADLGERAQSSQAGASQRHPPSEPARDERPPTSPPAPSAAGDGCRAGTEAGPSR